MQNLVSQIPTLPDFLKKVPKKHQRTTIKELIMIGLNVVKSSMSSSSAEQPPYDCQKQNSNHEAKSVLHQIERIKQNLEQLNQIVRNSPFNYTQPIHHQKYPQGSQAYAQNSNQQYSQTNNQKYSQLNQQRYPCFDNANNHQSSEAQDQTSGYFGMQNPPRNQNIASTIGNSLAKHFSFEPVRQPVIRIETPEQTRPEITPKVTETIPTVEGYAWNRRKCYSKHHLDDTESQAVLKYPVQFDDKNKIHQNRKSQEMRKHQYQEQINQEELVKLKNQPVKQQEGEYTKTRSSRKKAKSHYLHESATSQGDRFKKTKSKIKSLVERDRLRHHKKVLEEQFQQGFNKYEYSDENQMNQENQVSQEEENVHSNNQHFHQENTYDEHYHGSSQKNSNQQSSQKVTELKSKNQASIRKSTSKEPSAQEHHHFSRSGNNQNTYSKQNQENIEYEDEDVISNSSSFSQFSINGSQRREIGKISRKNDQKH